MAVKLPLPYMNESFSLVVSTGNTVAPGDLVMIDSNSQIDKAGATDDEYIGIVTYDDAHFANKQRTYFDAGEKASVESRGKIMRGISSASITAGNFVKLAAEGRIAPEASTTTKTLNTIGIAISTVSAAGSEIDFVKL